MEKALLKYNAVFKRVMRNKKLCKRLLAILLDREVTSLDYIETEHEALTDIDSKEIRLDCYSITADNKIFDVEMQVGDERELAKRMRAYQSIIDREAMSRNWNGKTMQYREMPSVCIVFICTEHPFKSQTEERICMRTITSVCAEEPSLELDTGATWLVFDAKMYKEAGNPQLGGFLRFVLTGEFDPENEFLSALNAEIEKFANGDEWLMLLDSRTEARTDGYYEGKDDGIAIGKAEAASHWQELISHLIHDGRLDQLEAATKNAECADELMREYGIDAN